MRAIRKTRTRVLGQPNRREIKRALVVQLVVSLICLGVFRYKMGGHVYLSSLYGACISIFPTWLFAAMIFRHQGASKAQLIVNQMYLGEGLKIGLTALLFGVVIAFTYPCWWVLFVSYLITQLSLSIGSLIKVSVHGIKY